ncbi:MAG: aminoacetone oxidase family FAD-binding enzyme [Clostridiales Family XIII bacterium]|nr:aminoacetone oxidase family FAD-binding enzyme [Clostridiales Family XIII bacterium]
MTKKEKPYAVAVLGGGAAGMAAALSAARDSHGTDGGEAGPAGALAGKEVLCLERNEEPGRKLLATGNGRCNFTNTACAEAGEVLHFFRGLGLLTRRDAEGRFYPYAGQAAVVRDALREELSRRGVALRCNAPVKALRRVAPEASAGEAPALPRAYFEMETADGALFRAERLVIATGGKAGPQYGCRGDGYAFARHFGHTVASPFPALVRMVCAEEERHRLQAIQGVRVKCAATLRIGDAPAGQSFGELLFTEKGLSGICILDLSRQMRLRGRRACLITLDLAPAIEERTLRELFAERRAAFLTGVLPAKLADLVFAEAKGDARAAARLIKGMEFSVTGTDGWRDAQVTSGGVSLGEVDADTMESKLVRGLFFAGEVLDYDGVCGGFNLNWAFRTGMRAGRAAARAARPDA